jgi:hypothetical protein
MEKFRRVYSARILQQWFRTILCRPEYPSGRRGLHFRAALEIMPRLSAEDKEWMRRLLSRERTPYTNTIIYVPVVKLRGPLYQLYLLLHAAVKSISRSFWLNNGVKFSQCNIHLTHGKEQLSLVDENVPAPQGRSKWFRVVRIHEGSVADRALHYTETWYTRDMYESMFLPV